MKKEEITVSSCRLADGTDGLSWPLRGWTFLDANIFSSARPASEAKPEVNAEMNVEVNSEWITIMPIMIAHLRGGAAKESTERERIVLSKVPKVDDFWRDSGEISAKREEDLEMAQVDTLDRPAGEPVACSEQLKSRRKLEDNIFLSVLQRRKS